MGLFIDYRLVFIILALSLLSIVLNGRDIPPEDDPNKIHQERDEDGILDQDTIGEYFEITPQSSEEGEEESPLVVIATYQPMSRMQCVHRCNRNKECVDVVMTTDGVCQLLNNTGNEVEWKGTERISRVPMPGIFISKSPPQKLPIKSNSDFYHFNLGYFQPIE